MRKENSFGSKISYYRKLNGLTQADLAKEIGVSCQAISKWEQQVCCPDILALPKIARIFGISIDELFNMPSGKDVSYTVVDNVPWNDDGKLRVTVYSGRKLLAQSAYVCSEGKNIINVHFCGGEGVGNIDGVCKIHYSK